MTGFALLLPMTSCAVRLGPMDKGRSGRVRHTLHHHLFRLGTGDRIHPMVSLSVCARPREPTVVPVLGALAG